ncbi:PepSY-associated TM helix domain-containing protein [Sphingopyxis sp.]|uniref:PepSY-associated TM helix domain-containing protein n=1 Tax=Sphingopyxis sp. TaxID=1908224 RepID=UPI002E08AFA9|nr:PepSY-associated TM helix domain-containing protein [Sphingopyxis sp.]
MKNGFRQSMAWLHTWTGLVLGWLLFAIFVTGTASYFQEEITAWMTPEVRSVPVDGPKASPRRRAGLSAKSPAPASGRSIRRASAPQACNSIG